MPTISELIDGLSRQGEACERNATALSKRPRAIPALRRALLHHPDPLVREMCADLLRDFRSTAAIPDLIAALRDPSPHVRFDALYALESILMVELRWWLRIEAYQDSPSKLHASVLQWWRRNRHYVWW